MNRETLSGQFRNKTTQSLNMSAAQYDNKQDISSIPVMLYPQ